MTTDVKEFAADYYHQALRRDGEFATFVVNGDEFTVNDYLFTRRKHSSSVIERYRVGLADGTFCETALGHGFTTEELIQAGLMREQNTADYWDDGLLLFPHVVNGRVSHFTQKDPARRRSYQARSQHRDPSCVLFNQDAAQGAEELVVVEGENDCLSVVDKAKYEFVAATNGVPTNEQIAFLRQLPSLRLMYLCFDNDEAGAKHAAKVRLRVDRRDLSVLFVHLPRAAQTELSPDADGLEREHMIAWSAVLALVKKHDLKVTLKANRRKALEVQVRAHPGMKNDEDLHDFFFGEDGFFDRVFSFDNADFDPKVGAMLLRRLLIEQKVVRPLQAKSLAATGPGDLRVLLGELQQETERILEIGQPPNLTSIGNLWQRHVEQLKARRGRELIGLKTGIRMLDEKTLGLRGLGVIGAGPGVGKTALCLQLGVGVCRHHRDNNAVVVFLSLDMSVDELMTRLTCHQGDLEWRSLVLGNREDSKGEALEQKLQLVQKSFRDDGISDRFFLVDRKQLGEDITAARIISVLLTAKRRVKAERALLIVDYLQILPVTDPKVNHNDLELDRQRIRLIQDVIEGTKSAKLPEGDAVLLISETRKPSSAKAQWGGGLAELMGTARLGYAVDYAIFYRQMDKFELPQYYAAGEAERLILEESGVAPIMLCLEKGRDGMMKGKWGMEFLFKKSTFRECLERPQMGFIAPVEVDVELAALEEDDKDMAWGAIGIP